MHLLNLGKEFLHFAVGHPVAGVFAGRFEGGMARVVEVHQAV